MKSMISKYEGVALSFTSASFNVGMQAINGCEHRIMRETDASPRREVAYFCWALRFIISSMRLVEGGTMFLARKYPTMLP